MVLTAGEGAMTFWKVSAIDDATRELYRLGIPFSIRGIAATYLDEESGCDYVTLWYTCQLLLPNGRCGSYENRPDLCRNFEEGSSPLCVHYRGAEAGDPTVIAI
jgi:Fe-S-cluster containining protein